MTSEYNSPMASQTEVDELLAKLHEQREGFLVRVADLGEEQAKYGPPDQDGEAGWSPKQQLSHLAEMEVSYRATARRAVTGEDVPAQPVRFPLQAAHTATVAQHLEALRELRAQTLDYIHSLPLAAFDARVVTGTFPEMSVLQWLRSYYRHDRMHLAQIEGRASDYQPRFVGGEPDQRRRA